MKRKEQLTAAHASKELEPKSYQIAIDGPAGVGKSTIASRLAEILGFLYVDTSALYRSLAYIATRDGIDPADAESLASAFTSHKIELRVPTGGEKDGRLVTVLLDGEDISWAIRTPEISKLTPITSQHLAVRELVKDKQLEYADKNVIMEGRDITHAILPDAQVKIQLEADPEVRAERIHKALQAKGSDRTYEDVLADLLVRDAKDREKNLKHVPDAWLIDTTHLTIDEVFDRIYQRAKLQFELE